MKFARLIGLLLVLLISIEVKAVSGNFTLSWDPYPVGTATMHGMCKIGNAMVATEVGTIAATSNSLDFTVDVPMGASMDCFVFASLSGQTSPVSSTVTYAEPVVLPPVTGCALRRR